MLTFANSALLWGLALGSVPIIIYLLNRRRFKRVVWAAMEFLLQAMKKNRRRLRIENLLLLIIRTLIVLFFALAIARPLLKATGIIRLLKETRNWVIVIDNSYSMGYKTGPTTSLERAVKYARSIAEKLESGDRISILLMNSSPEPLYETPITVGGESDRKSVLADINEIRPSWKTTDVPKTLDKVVDILAKFEDVPPDGEAKEEKAVFLLTDCQFNSWARQGVVEAKHLKKISDAFVKHKAELQVLDMGEEEAPNFAITELSCDHALVGTDIPVSFSATLTNFSKRRFRDVVVELMVDDLRQKRLTVQLEPGVPQKVAFSYQFKDKGYHHVRVSAKTDPLGADNEAYLAVNVREQVNILVVDGRPSTSAWESEIDYLKAFFEAGLSDEEGHKVSPFGADYWTHMRFEDEMQGSQPVLKLRRYDVIVLANLPDLTQEAASAVQKYVEEGGSLLMFLGDMVIPERYNLILYNEGKGLLPVRLIDVAGDREGMTPLSLNIETYDHPITQFFENWKQALRRPMTFLYYANELPAGSQDTIVLITYSDDKKTIAVVEKRFGDGRVLLVTNCAGDEPANKWNNWNKYQFFPILLGESLSYLGQSSKRKMNYMVGEVYQRLLSMSEWASEVYIVPPTGESIPKNLRKISEEEGGLKEEDEDDTRFLLAHEETDTAGIYRVAFTGRQNVPGVAERTENFAVNVDTGDSDNPGESDMTKLVQSELQEAMPTLDPKPEIKHYSEVRKKDITKGADEAGGREFWKYLIYSVLALLAVESLLAQRFGKRQK